MLRKFKNAVASKAAIVGASFVTAMLVPVAASHAAVDTAIQSAFSGTGQNILDNVSGLLPDVLIPFVALLVFSLGMKLYHKVRG
jgi:hypothetical protein